MVLNAFKSRIFLLQPTKGTTKDTTTFMNSENSKTSQPYRLLLNLADKTNIKRSDKYIALSNLSMYYTWKNVKKSYKNNKIAALT